MTLSVLEGRFPIACLFMGDFLYFIHLAFRLAVRGEGRNFKFGTDVDRNKSEHTDDK